jgi:hypothetical protein
MVEGASPCAIPCTRPFWAGSSGEVTALGLPHTSLSKQKKSRTEKRRPRGADYVPPVSDVRETAAKDHADRIAQVRLPRPADQPPSALSGEPNRSRVMLQRTPRSRNSCGNSPYLIALRHSRFSVNVSRVPVSRAKTDTEAYT